MRSEQYAEQRADAAGISSMASRGQYPASELPMPAQRPRPRLLWVDDSENLLSLYKAVFESLGFDIVTTSSPSEAVSYAKLFADLVILDYDMPEINGAELASLIKNHHPSLPIVLHSGNTALRAASYKSVDALSEKGAPREELLGVIDRLLPAASGRKQCQPESLPSRYSMFPPSCETSASNH
jgi:CheY-like chemotaxis protein